MFRLCTRLTEHKFIRLLHIATLLSLHRPPPHQPDSELPPCRPALRLGDIFSNFLSLSATQATSHDLSAPILHSMSPLPAAHLLSCRFDSLLARAATELEIFSIFLSLCIDRLPSLSFSHPPSLSLSASDRLPSPWISRLLPSRLPLSTPADLEIFIVPFPLLGSQHYDEITAVTHPHSLAYSHSRLYEITTVVVASILSLPFVESRFSFSIELSGEEKMSTETLDGSGPPDGDLDGRPRDRRWWRTHSRIARYGTIESRGQSEGVELHKEIEDQLQRRSDETIASCALSSMRSLDIICTVVVDETELRRHIFPLFRRRAQSSSNHTPLSHSNQYGSSYRHGTVTTISAPPSLACAAPSSGSYEAMGAHCSAPQRRNGDSHALTPLPSSFIDGTSGGMRRHPILLDSPLLLSLFGLFLDKDEDDEAKLVKRREEHTRATGLAIDEERLYYDAAGSAPPKGVLWARITCQEDEELCEIPC
ncbi:hypothetical protein Scep_026287 [Stephania cephalantha]|uniref:Uncharacterized protein n=1 Tax=Stephania cephalantha TaxID=152367 RepID=A0AAP0EQF7_9MAGN